MAFVVGSFSSLVVNILIFLPFELGAKEGALYVMFGWIGVTPALGIAAAALSRMRELIWIAVGWDAHLDDGLNQPPRLASSSLAAA